MIGCEHRVHYVYDPLALRGRLQHGDNPEAVLIVDDWDKAQMGPRGFITRVQHWIDDCHAYLKSGTLVGDDDHGD
jgi:hypothetical protein